MMAIPAEEVLARLLTPEQRARARKRGEDLVAEYKTLQQLRKARELTQNELAELLGKDQVSISQLEKRSDMLLSTLRSYVEAMGGTLNLVVQFEGQPAVILSGFTEEEEGSRKRKHGADARSAHG